MNWITEPEEEEIDNKELFLLNFCKKLSWSNLIFLKSGGFWTPTNGGCTLSLVVNG